ncbi:MAG: serine hydrolase, partial [Lentimicrobium sp.]|nr:serine hydrolase [Lentimicrobium sp.]
MKLLFKYSLIIIMALAATLKSAAQESQITDKLDKYFSEALDKWKVPGMAIAITIDDRIVLLRGYGVKEAGRSGKVDENTSFAV